jgi:hypothetical protein
MTFLPENYSVPSPSGNYLKFEQGETRFRFLTSPIVGNEYWNHDGKPVRKRTTDSIDHSDIRPEKDGRPGVPKHFWAAPVLNYREKRVQILEITQKGIMQSISALAKDGDWGTPLEYDLVVSREGEGMETKYQVIPKPAKPLDSEAKKAWDTLRESGFNLEALYDGTDPFAAGGEVPAKRSEDTEPLPPEEIDIDDIEI